MIEPVLPTIKSLHWISPSTLPWTVISFSSTISPLIVATIKGEIVEENEITVQGNVDGDIQCKDLIVGKTGSIKGKIKADTLYVEGSIEGEIHVKELLKLMSSSYVSGKITYGSLQINEGGKLVGEIEFKDKDIIQEEFKEWKSLWWF